MSVLEYKCPNCGGTLKFDATSQKMLCEYCDSTFDMDILEKYEKSVLNGTKTELDLGEYDSESGSGDWTTEEIQGMKAYSCPSCGGQIIGDETSVATKCPYCDSATVIPGQFNNDKKPDYVLPFFKTKKDAEEAFRKNTKGKKLLPDVFLSEQRIESIKGIYVPFWLFDSKINADYTYKATKVRSWSDSDNRYTETSTYMVERGGTVDFKKVPVDGSSKMEDTLMESIEPFNYEKLVPFTTAYLSGYMADKYDVDVAECKPRAVERINSSVKSLFDGTVSGYSTTTVTNTNSSVVSSDMKYALLPVWLLNTKYKDKIYTFAMNGQTGKFVGELPVSKEKVRKEFLKWFIPATVILGIITYFI